MKNKKRTAFVKRIEKVYEPKVTPDRTDELIKKAEEAKIRFHKKALAQRRRREDFKRRRILTTKEDKFTHAINLIIERAEYQKTKSDSFNIDYHDFNFADTMDKSRVLEGFLKKLKKVGAIKSYSRQNYSGGTRFGFRGVNANRLKEYKLHGEKISADGFSSPLSFPQKPPKSWRLEETKGKTHIIKDDKTLFTFLYTWTDKYSYFKCAWQKYNQVVPYKELYESKPERKYPNEKGKNWKVNDNIRATIRKLREKFRNKKVPIAIETKNGIRVFVRK